MSFVNYYCCGENNSHSCSLSLSFYLTIYLSIYLSIFLSITLNTPTYQPAYLSIYVHKTKPYRFIYLSIYLSICPSFRRRRGSRAPRAILEQTSERKWSKFPFSCLRVSRLLQTNWHPYMCVGIKHNYLHIQGVPDVRTRSELLSFNRWSKYYGTTCIK